MENILMMRVFRASARAKKTLVVRLDNRWRAKRCMMKEAGAWFKREIGVVKVLILKFFSNVMQL